MNLQVRRRNAGIQTKIKVRFESWACISGVYFRASVPSSAAGVDIRICSPRCNTVIDHERELLGQVEERKGKAFSG